MKVRTFIWGLLISASLLFISCNDDDDYSLGKFWVSMATVENQESSPYFFFDLDNGQRMWTAATNLPGYRPKSGQRIIANYTILSDRGEGSSYDHDVKLNDVYSVLTKEIVEITQENNEELGNDLIQISDIWIGGDHLNVEFIFAGQNKTHYINLGKSMIQNGNNGEVHLELRHNAYGDSPVYSKWGMASFNLKPLKVDGVESLTLVVHVQENDAPEGEIYELIYKFNEQPVGDKKITFGDDLGQIK